MKPNIKNERTKRRYLVWIRDAKGLSPATIQSIEQALWLYEDATGDEDYGAFNPKKAAKIKEWLDQRRHSGQTLSDSTKYHYLRHLKDFFGWLATQSGYRSKIRLTDVEYLSMERKKVREITAPRLVDYPSLDYVKRLVQSIHVETEIDRRDRALICFLLLTGIRVKALTTLPLGCFNRETGEISQIPSRGVDTKFGKPMVTYLFRFDDEMVGHVVDWAEFLEKSKLFGQTDPLFPRTRVAQGVGDLTFQPVGLEPVFWEGTGSVRQILKHRAQAAGLKYYHPHAFRHAAVALAFRRCRSGEELKAVSQNFGHEDVGTTTSAYANMDGPKMKEVLGQMDFTGTGQPAERNAAIDEMIQKLASLKT